MHRNKERTETERIEWGWTQMMECVCVGGVMGEKEREAGIKPAAWQTIRHHTHEYTARDKQTDETRKGVLREILQGKKLIFL